MGVVIVTQLGKWRWISVSRSDHQEPQHQLQESRLMMVTYLLNCLKMCVSFLFSCLILEKFRVQVNIGENR